MNTTKKSSIGLHELKSVIDESSTIANKHLGVLHKALKSKDSSAVLKKGFIDVRSFRIGFDEFGFFIRDLNNFNKKTDFSSEDAFPSPREVWEFITKPRINNADKDEEASRMKKIIRYNKEVKKATSPETEKVSNKKEKEPEKEIDLEAQRKKAIAAISRAKDGHKLFDKLNELIPNRSYKVFLGKIYRQFKYKKIRIDKFKKLVTELTKTISFEEKKKPAPKFVGLPFWKISELHFEDNDKVTLIIPRDRQEPYRYKITQSELLARLILNIEPFAMYQMFKMLNGEITPEQFIAEPFKRDKYVHFKNELIHTESHNKVLFDACIELLYLWGVPNPLNKSYSNNCPLKKGDELKVFFQDLHTYYEGEVIDTSDGIIIRYSDGDVQPLMKHSVWQKLH